MDLKDQKNDLDDLIELAAQVVNALKGSEVNSRVHLAEATAFKIISHAIVASAITNGVPFPPRPSFNGVDPLLHDPGSLLAIARVVAEGVLAFTYVFVEPEDEGEFELRYNAWMLSGFVQRESYPLTLDATKEQVEFDRIENERLRTELKSNARFLKLTNGEQNAILNGKRWRLETIVDRVRWLLGEVWGESLYAYLSSWCHGDALPMVQLRDSPKNEDRKKLFVIGLLVVSTSLAALTDAYAARFPLSQQALDANPELAQKKDFYAGLFLRLERLQSASGGL